MSDVFAILVMVWYWHTDLCQQLNKLSHLQWDSHTHPPSPEPNGVFDIMFIIAHVTAYILYRIL